jgi:hypothetical protein
MRPLGVRFVILPALFAALTYGQTTSTATLVGSVSDGTGAMVPGVKVTVTNMGTGFRSTTVTSAEGSYYVPYLSPGTYRIAAEAAGFKLYVRDGFDIRMGETPRLDMALDIGSTSEQVTVTAAAPLLNTETAATGQIMGVEAMAKFPIPQKRLQRILFYYPGVISSNGESNVLGQRSRSLSITLDGINAKIPAIGTNVAVDHVLQTTMDAMEEVKVTTAGIAAEFGHSAGGAQTVVYKSGTNDLHGSFEDRIMAGPTRQRSYMQQNKQVNEFHIDHFEGYASGPIYLPKLYNGKNRTFFLFGFGLSKEIGVEPSGRFTVPTDQMYNGDFSFGGIGLPIYNPFTTRETSPGSWTRDPFPGNQVPKSLFDPVTLNFLANNPYERANDAGVPSRTGPTQNLIADQPKFVKRTRWDIKADHQFSAAHKIFGRYSHGHHKVTNANNPVFAWRLIDVNGVIIPTDSINGILSDTLILSPSRFNEFRVGYNRRATSFVHPTWGQDWAGKLGIPNVSPLSFPVLYLMSALGRSREVGEDIVLQNNFTQIAGRHTFKAGYELMRTRYNAVLTSTPSGTYSFSGTELPYTPNTGNTFASFLLGTVGSATFTQDFASWLPRWWAHAFFVQDEWKPWRGLTINLGLRWSYESPFRTKEGQQSQFDPKVVDPLSGKMGAITHPKSPLANRDLNNLQPRLGVAWNFRPKWVFRSSFGMMTQDLGALSVAQNFQEYVGTANYQSPPGDPRNVFRLSQGPPTPVTYPVTPDGYVPYTGTNFGARTAQWFDPQMRMPYIMNWSAGFQYEFRRNWLAELVYQGTSGVGLPNAWDINVIPLDISKDPAVLNQIYQAQQNYKPYPQFGNVTHFSNYGHNTHHSGTARLEKRFSAGLHMVGFYTWSKTLDESDTDGTASGITFYNRRLEKARAGYDVRHHFVGTVMYDLPFGKGKKWFNSGGFWSRYLAGGWNIVWIQTLESGLPSTVGFAGSPNRYIGGARPVALTTIEEALVNDWNMGPHRFPTSAQNPYLRFESFAYPAAFTPGTLGRNVFESPGLNWMQSVITKEFAVREQLRFSMRAELCNLPFKQPNLARPNSTYNANSPLTFGRFSGDRGGLVNVGGSQPNIVIGFRVEF